MKAERLHEDFAAEIRGINLIDVVTDQSVYEAVRSAFELYSVLVFRSQIISDEVQALFSRAFGPLEITKPGAVGTGTVYAHITNIGPDGKTVNADDHLALVVAANQLWHTDSSFKKTPALASMLGARIVPRGNSETQFVSTRAAWARLSDSDRNDLQGLVVEHNYLFSREQIDPHMVSAEERALLPGVRRRMTWLNPVTGQHALYVASHAGRIDGMNDEKARALLSGLIDHCTVPKHVYRHIWQAGDAVLWDNRATMHRGVPWPLNEPRLSIRTTISACERDGLASVLVH
jgi:alpha-ketoglutarate-dependent 2,4-dichlorophenoxyacetate dioxygenase